MFLLGLSLLLTGSVICLRHLIVIYPIIAELEKANYENDLLKNAEHKLHKKENRKNRLQHGTTDVGDMKKHFKSKRSQPLRNKTNEVTILRKQNEKQRAKD